MFFFFVPRTGFAWQSFNLVLEYISPLTPLTGFQLLCLFYHFWSRRLFETCFLTAAAEPLKETNIFQWGRKATPPLNFFKRANPGLFLFLFVFSTCHDSNIIWLKHRWCAWDLNPGWQDRRHRQIHWATAAPLLILIFCLLHTLSGPFWSLLNYFLPYHSSQFSIPDI